MGRYLVSHVPEVHATQGEGHTCDYRVKGYPFKDDDVRATRKEWKTKEEVHGCNQGGHEGGVSEDDAEINVLRTENRKPIDNPVTCFRNNHLILKRGGQKEGITFF